MDPMTLILTALGAGAAAGGQAIASDAIKDAYTGLKTLIQRKLSGNSSAELALTKHAADPTKWESSLRKALVQVHVDQDEDIIEAAQRVMEQINPQQAEMGKYNLQVTGDVQGINQGDYNTITQTFGDISKDK
jgi:hypothetical protein